MLPKLRSTQERFLLTFRFGQHALDVRTGQNNELHCALETRYIRYIVVNQQLNPLQISYRPVTPVTPLFINNLACNKPAKFLEPIPHVRIATLFLAGTARRAGLAY